MSAETGTIAWEGGEVSAAWHDAGSDAWVALAHGAGGTMHAPSLRAYAEALAARGIGAVRFNFAYAEAGRRAPDRSQKLLAVWRAVAARTAERANRVFLGGRSMGGRYASHLVAEGVPAAGLVFLAYPLHPPGRPEKIRDAHLAGIGCPMLFLQGTRDPFAERALLEKTVAALPRATLRWVEGGDHSHKVAGRTAAEVVDELAGVTAQWIAAV